MADKEGRSIARRAGTVGLLLGLCVSPTLFAAFDDTGTGARPTALGDTYVVAGDDVQSLMVNPAGLAKMNRKEVTSEYSRLYTGLTDQSNIGQYFMGYGQRIHYGGTLALGWRQLNLDDLYVERTVSVGYGEWITPRVAVGFALKQLYHAFGIPNQIVDNSGNVRSGVPDFFHQNGNSNTAYSSDIGILARLTPQHTLGLSIQDLNEPNIALSNDYRRIVPRTTRLGLSYKATPETVLLSGSLTMRQTLSHQTDYTWTGSAERWWPLKNSAAVALRGSLANGSREFHQVAAGPSYRMSGFQMDYTMVFNLSGIGIGDTSGTHRFSLTYRFGPEPERTIGPGQKKLYEMIDSNPPTLEPWLNSLNDLMNSPLPETDVVQPSTTTVTVSSAVAPAPMVPVVPVAPTSAETVSGAHQHKPILIPPRKPVTPSGWGTDQLHRTCRRYA